MLLRIIVVYGIDSKMQLHLDVFMDRNRPIHIHLRSGTGCLYQDLRRRLSREQKLCAYICICFCLSIHDSEFFCFIP